MKTNSERVRAPRTAAASGGEHPAFPSRGAICAASPVGRRIRIVASGWWLTLCSFSLGCAPGVQTDYSQLELVRVSGKVTLDGKPLASAIVEFVAEDSTYSFGLTDKLGNYNLMFNSERRGVTPGPKVVRIRTGGGLDDEASAPLEGEEELTPSPRELVPACYHERSQLKVTVAGRSQQANFDLRSDCSVAGPS